MEKFTLRNLFIILSAITVMALLGLKISLVDESPEEVAKEAVTSVALRQG